MALQLLLWLGAGVLSCVALIVVVPIHVTMSWQSDPAKPSTVLLRPFGGVSPPIKVYDSSKPARARKSRRKSRKSHKRDGTLPRKIFGEGLALLRHALGAIHIDRLHLDAEFGLGDPAETGQLYGQLCPLIYTSGGHVTVRPNFDRACLQGSALAQLHFSILGLIWPFIRFGWRVFGPQR